jgi:Tol biopolymer transport system component
VAIYRQRADSGGNAERLTQPEPGTQHVPESWSRSGVISFSVQSGAQFSLWTLSLSNKRATRFPGVESNVVAGSAFSPDGKWIAYQAGEWLRRGANKVAAFVEPFPPTGEKY